jgi:hypothetical protein
MLATSHGMLDRCPASRPADGAFRGAGDRRTDAEIEGLLADLVRDAHHCPDGRPTAVAFGRRDLERFFKRT